MPSAIGVPDTLYIWRHFLLDGGLALATVQESKLCIWRKDGPEVDGGWTQDRVVELENLFPNDVLGTFSNVVGFADGTDVIFLRAGYMLYTIDLKTYEMKKVCNKNIYSAIPYMSFCTPGTIFLRIWFCNIQVRKPPKLPRLNRVIIQRFTRLNRDNLGSPRYASRASPRNNTHTVFTS
jgi:hypothetical protein